ncbi:metal-dependent phosphohydrolase [Catenulispora subtropica]|uniref:Metal-dependent phosphohydrolase n=1 Tax=Catenulispora subtropica TaxID=450798 RepID=A0ABP5DI76_9ACTN
MAKSLHERWLALAGITPESIRLGDDLVARWSEPHRRYHTLEHLTRVLDGVDEFGGYADDVTAVRYAAWFHDAVYDGGEASGDNEELSAQLAETELPVLLVPPERVAEVARLVRLTKGHAAAEDDRNGAVLCDADLAVLGGRAADYAAYKQAIRQEYSEVPDELFRPGRAAVLKALLELPALFRTPVAVERYEKRARANLSAEIAELEG